MCPAAVSRKLTRLHEHSLAKTVYCVSAYVSFGILDCDVNSNVCVVYYVCNYQVVCACLSKFDSLISRITDYTGRY